MKALQKPLAIGVAAVLLSITVSAQDQGPDSVLPAAAPEPTTGVSVTVSHDVDPTRSTITNLIIYDRNKPSANVDLPAVTVRIVEDSLHPGLANGAQQAPIRTVQLNVTPLAPLFWPLIDTVAQDLGAEEPLPLLGSSKFALTVTTTGAHNLLAEAISGWARSKLQYLDSSNKVTAADHREYLQEASNIIKAFGSNDILGLLPEQLRIMLDTQRVNEQHAIARDEESFRLAQEKGTPSAYQVYLSSFPRGRYKVAAEKARHEAVNSCIQTAADNKIMFRDGNANDGWPLMVMVPGGTYRRGSEKSDKLSTDNERPVDEVTIPRPLAVGVYELKSSEYNKSLALGNGAQNVSCWQQEGDAWKRSEPEFDDSALPATCVSWYDATRYTDWRSQGLPAQEQYRLLSEAEWEYVARAGKNAQRYHFGEFATSCDARFNSNNDECTFNTVSNDAATCRTTESPGPLPVGCYEANAFGVSDMHGNVWEWVADTWTEDYEGSNSDGTAVLDTSQLRVVRGGSWADDARYLRSAMRGRNLPDTRTDFIGLRLARDVHICPPRVSLLTHHNMVKESSQDGFEITVELGTPQRTPTVVELILSGTATYQDDYTVLGSGHRITIEAGETSGTVSFVLSDDGIAEGNEHILVDGVAAGMRVDGTKVILTDNDERVELSADRVEIPETDGSIDVTVTAELKDVGRGYLYPEVNVALSFGGIAADSIDYLVDPESPTITIEEGETSGTVTMTVTPIEDGVREGMIETIEIQGRVLESELGVTSAIIALREREI